MIWRSIFHKKKKKSVSFETYGDLIEDFYRFFSNQLLRFRRLAVICSHERSKSQRGLFGNTLFHFSPLKKRKEKKSQPFVFLLSNNFFHFSLIKNSNIFALSYHINYLSLFKQNTYNKTLYQMLIRHCFQCGEL